MIPIEEKLVNKQIYDSYTFLENTIKYCVKEKIAISLNLDETVIKAISIPLYRPNCDIYIFRV